MTTYLHQYYYATEPVKDIINKLAEEAGLTTDEWDRADHIANGIYLIKNSKHFCLSEFPGNCSTLVLHNIVDSEIRGGKVVDVMYLDALPLAEAICQTLKYAALMMSVSNINMANDLIDLGFEPVITDLRNPHSGNLNHFMIKYIEQT